MLILEERDGRLVHEYAIDTPPGHPLIFDETQTYSGDATQLVACRTYEWIHSLSRVVGALLDAGLVLEFLHEYPFLPWRPFPMCVPAEGGMYRLPDHVPTFPLAYFAARPKAACRGANWLLNSSEAEAIRMPVNLSIKHAPDELVAKLKMRAKQNHRSLQGELLVILEEAAARPLRRLTAMELLQEVQKLGFETPSESVEIIRKMRDGR